MLQVYIPLFLSFLFSLPSPGECVAVLASVQDVRLINNVRTTHRVATLKCSEEETAAGAVANFQIPIDTGGAHTLSIECTQPERHFDIFYRGVVSRDGKMVVVRQITSKNNIRFVGAQSQSQSSGSGSGAGQRTLLGILLHSRKLLSGSSCQSEFVQFWTGGDCRTTGLFPADVDDPTRGSGIAIQLTAHGGSYSRSVQLASDCVGTGRLTANNLGNQPCHSGTAESELETFRAMSRNLTDDMTRFASSWANMANQEAFLISNLTGLATETSKYGSHFNQSSRNLLVKGAAQYSTALVVEENLRSTLLDQADALSNATRLMRSNNDLLSSAINRTSENDRILQQNINAMCADAGEKAVELIRATMEDRVSIFARLRSIASGYTNAFTLLQLFALNEGPLNSINARVQEVINDPSERITPRGHSVEPFTEDEGMPPVSNPRNMGALFSTLIASQDSVRQIVTLGGNPVGIQVLLTFRCGTYSMVERAPFDPNWEEIAAMIGPPGCDDTYTTQVGDPGVPCGCVVEVEESRCVLLNNNGVVSDSTQRRWFGSNANGTFDGCASAPASYSQEDGGHDDMKLKSTQAVAELLADISSRGMYGSTKYRLSSFKFRYESDVPYDERVSNSSNFVSLVDPQVPSPSSPGASAYNLVFAYFNSLRYSYQNTYQNIDPYRERVYGVLPAGIKLTKLLFDYFPGYGVGGGAIYAFLMMYSTSNFVTVSSAALSHSVFNVKVTVNGVTTVTSDVTVVNHKAAFLRDFRDFLWSPQLSSTVWWDAPGSTVVISPHAGRRRNRVTYAKAADEARFGRVKWEQENSFEFDHSLAGNVASAYEVPLVSDENSPLYGRCLRRAGVIGGSQCLIRDAFAFTIMPGSYSDPYSPGRFILSDRNAEYIFQVTIPEGPIVEILSSSCPILSDPVVDGTTLLVIARNPLPDQNIIRVEQSGFCSSSQDVRLAGSSEAILRFARCPQAPLDTPDQVRISYYSGDDLVPCLSDIALSYTPEGIGAVEGPISAGFAYQITSLGTDSVLDFINQMRIDNIDLSYRLLESQMTQQKSLGLAFSPKNLLRYEDLLQKLARNAEDAVASAEAARRRKSDISAAIQSLRAELDALDAQGTSEVEEGKALSESVLRRIANAEVSARTTRELGSIRKFDLQQAILSFGAWSNAAVKFLRGGYIDRTNTTETLSPEERRSAYEVLTGSLSEFGSRQVALPGRALSSILNGPESETGSSFKPDQAWKYAKIALTAVLLVVVAAALGFLIKLTFTSQAEAMREHEEDQKALTELMAELDRKISALRYVNKQ